MLKKKKAVTLFNAFYLTNKNNFSYEFKKDHPDKRRMGVISEELSEELQIKADLPYPDLPTLRGYLIASVKVLYEKLTEIKTQFNFSYEFKKDHPDKRRMGVISEELSEELQIKADPPYPDLPTLRGYLIASVKVLYEKLTEIKTQFNESINKLKEEFIEMKEQFQKRISTNEKALNENNKRLSENEKTLNENNKKLSENNKRVSNNEKELKKTKAELKNTKKELKEIKEELQKIKKRI